MKKYMEIYRNRIIGLGVIAFLLHGYKLRSVAVGIDTEDLIRLQEEFYSGWLQTGRQGLVFLKQLLGNDWFNPFFSGLMTLLFLTLGVSAFFLLWERALGRDGRDGSLPFILGGLLWISHPVLTEQLYFALQDMEICLGILLTAGALWLTEQSAGAESRRKRIGWGIGAAALLALVFSVYQIFVVLYIFGTVSLLLLHAIRRITEDSESTGIREDWKALVPYLLVFLVAFLVNTCVTEVFFSDSSYLSNQIAWGKIPVKDNLLGIVYHMGKVFTGLKGVHFSAVLGFLSILLFVLLVRLGIRRGRLVWRIFLLTGALLSTPFLMTLVCGTAPAVRSQLVLPGVVGFVGYLVLYLGSLERKSAENVLKKSGCKIAGFLLAAGIVIGVTGSWKQIQTTLRLYYTDACRYEQDEALGRALVQRIQEEFGTVPYSLAVIGTKAFQPNNACLEGEVIGKSFFDYDDEVEPEYYWSTRRIIGLLHTLGYEYHHAPVEAMEDAAIYAEEMPVWPEEGCVRIEDGIVYVKLSE